MTLHFGDWCGEITISNCGSHLLGKEGEGGHPDPEVTGGVLKKMFGPQFGRKIGGRSGPPGPLTGIRHCFVCVNRSPILYGFRAGSKAIRHSMNVALGTILRTWGEWGTIWGEGERGRVHT